MALIIPFPLIIPSSQVNENTYELVIPMRSYSDER